jgi:hypothetical protein
MMNDTIDDGYLIYALSSDHDRITAAICLTNSIMAVDDSRKICLVTDDKSTIPPDIFDIVLELPFGTDTNYEMINFWQIYHCTPFARTMYLDAFGLLLSPLDEEWSALNGESIVTPISLNFKNDTPTHPTSRKTYEKNNITNVPTSMLYFEKCALSSEFFEMLDISLRSWYIIYKEILTENVPETFDFEMICSITWYLIGKTPPNKSWLCITDISSYSVGLSDDESDDEFNPHIWCFNGNVRINNYSQRGYMYYRNPTIMDKFKNEFY